MRAALSAISVCRREWNMSNAELERYRQQQQIADLQKQLALRDEENQKLRRLLAALMAEHAEGPGRCDQLKAQLEDSERECAKLRHSIESSVALKMARSIPWLLGPLRSLFTRRTS
jgi:hypothetical protein